MQESALVVRNLSKIFPNGTGIDSLNFEVESGKIFGFLGPNGSGKTTLIRCLMDEIKSYDGAIEIFSQNPRSNAELKKMIGYISSGPQLYDSWNGHDHLNFLKKYRGTFDAKPFIKRLDLDMNTKYRDLSSGNKQKLALLVALYGAPKLLIMDEPTKALDPLLQQEFYKILFEYRRSGGTVFMSSHNLPEVERLCDSFALIKKGKIIVNESIDALKNLSIKEVSVTTEEPLNTSLLKAAGANVTSHHASTATLRVRGDINPIIKLLARHKIKDIQITHADLEDIFMEFYK